MNDPMNHDPIDRELDQLLGRAFAARPDGPVSTPSMLDVRHRARLRHRRRAGAMLGSVALVGAGGVGVLARGHDDPDRVATPGAGSDATGGSVDLPSTTAVCTPVTTAVDPGVFATTTVTILTGDAGIDTTATNDAATSTTTTFPPGAFETLPPYECVENGVTAWACSGPMGQDDQGRPLFSSCEPVMQGWPAAVPTVTTTVCLDGSDCLPQTTVVPTTTCGPTDDCGSTTATAPPFGAYVIQVGDTPAYVALKFDVTVADLDELNAGTPGYDNFIVGATILIPPSNGLLPTTSMPTDQGGATPTQAPLATTTTTLAG